MTKEEFTQLLKDAGYNAQNIDGVVMVSTTADERRRIWREVRKMALEASFTSSMGISIVKT